MTLFSAVIVMQKLTVAFVQTVILSPIGDQLQQRTLQQDSRCSKTLLGYIVLCCEEHSASSSSCCIVVRSLDLMSQTLENDFTLLHASCPSPDTNETHVRRQSTRLRGGQDTCDLLQREFTVRLVALSYPPPSRLKNLTSSARIWPT